MNVLYKSTANWNPGDDLSYLGTRKVLFPFLGLHNEFFYDASPEMNEILTARLAHRVRPVLTDVWHYKRKIHLDLIVIAGTPIWRNYEVKVLQEYVIEHQTPIIYIGVGTTSGKQVPDGDVIGPPDETWNYCKGFIARDGEALHMAKRSNYLDGKVICCPSIFAFDVLEKLGTKTGIVFQASTRIVQQYDFIKKKMKTDDVLLIVHEIGDYEVLTHQFPEYKNKIVYSRNLDMLVRFYSMCNKIYSMRLHGTHLAFTLGIPTVCLKTKHPKARACHEISVKLLDPGEYEIKEEHLISREKIIKIKKEKLIEYNEYLSKCKLCEK